jgi:uncharacterized membrane protein YfcA
VLTFAVWTLLAGVVAGSLGALLGIGGGVLLVPLLHGVLGLSISEAAAVSLVGVLAVSASVSATSRGRELFNSRLAILLLIFSVGGATFGAKVLNLLSEATYERIFGATAAAIAVILVARLSRADENLGADADVGVLGNRYHDDYSDTDVAYRVRRVPVAATVSFAAGVLASFLGIGGGVLLVPALNAWCGVPIRVAAATSAFMIGVTAVPGTITHYAEGHLNGFELAAAVSLGAMAGYRLGLWLASRAPVHGLKLLMAGVLGAIAVVYLVR